MTTDSSENQNQNPNNESAQADTNAGDESLSPEKQGEVMFDKDAPAKEGSEDDQETKEGEEEEKESDEKDDDEDKKEGEDDKEKDKDDAKKKDEKKGDETTFEAFTAPEGVVISDEDHAEFSEFARANNWNQEQAQAAVDFYFQQVNKLQSQNASNWEETQKQWRRDCVTHHEIGGEKFPGIVKEVNAMMNHFSPPMLDDDGKQVTAKDPETGENVKLSRIGHYMITSGLGNHPDMIHFLHTVRQHLSEDSFVNGGGGPGPTGDPLEKMFDNSPGMK